MSRALWVNPVFGVSGDMLLGALVSIGDHHGFVEGQLELLALEGWGVEFSTVKRRGISATRAHVRAEEQIHRPWSEIDSLLAGANLDERVSSGARETFGALARAEAGQHGVAVDEVEFHEVGAIDAIVDIVGCWAALSALEVTTVQAAPIGLGAGSVQAAHGLLPHPAPAVLALLDGIPVVPVDTIEETATPTGVALLATMVHAWGPVPVGKIVSSGLGAGGRDPESHANVLSALILETRDAPTTTSVLVETNLDDVTPETLAYLSERLLDAGADDVWTVPIVMKKGRSGHELRVLCPPPLESSIVELVAKETGTLGIRTSQIDKTVFPRTFGSVELHGHEIGIKSGPYGAKPEFEDLKRVAAATGRGLSELRESALEAWRALAVT